MCSARSVWKHPSVGCHGRNVKSPFIRRPSKVSRTASLLPRLEVFKHVRIGKNHEKGIPGIFFRGCVKGFQSLDSMMRLTASTTSAEEYFPPVCFMTNPMALLAALSFLA